MSHHLIRENQKTFTLWKQCIGCKVNILLPWPIKYNNEYHCKIKSKRAMMKKIYERNLESVCNTTSVVLHPLSNIDINSFINSLSSHYPQMNWFIISCESLKIIFCKLYFEYQNVLPIIPECILPIIFPHLFLPDRKLKKKSEFYFTKIIILQNLELRISFRRA